MKKLVMQSAWDFVRIAGMKLSDALSQAWALISKKAEHIYKIVFKKESTGEITEREIKEPTINRKGNLMFFDIDNNGIRSAKPCNIISFQKI